MSNSFQCSQKPSAESHPQTVESSPHFDPRLPKTDFDVFQSICFQFSQVSHAFSLFIHEKWKWYIGRILRWSMGYEIVTQFSCFLLVYTFACLHTVGVFGRAIAQGAKTHFTEESCAPNCLLCGGPKGIRTLNLVYYFLQLHQGKRMTILVIAIIWTCIGNIWT